MSSTTCETCKGYRTVCGRCGKPRKRRLRNDFSWGRCCYGARLKPCPKHVETAHACDVCLKPVASVKWSNIAGAWRDACPACLVGWERWVAVASDAFLEAQGNAPKIDAMRRAVDVEHLRAVAFVAGFSRTIADQLAGHLAAASPRPLQLDAQGRGRCVLVELSGDEAATVDSAAGLVTPSSGAPDPVG